MVQSAPLLLIGMAAVLVLVVMAEPILTRLGLVIWVALLSGIIVGTVLLATVL